MALTGHLTHTHTRCERGDPSVGQSCSLALLTLQSDPTDAALEFISLRDVFFSFFSTNEAMRRGQNILAFSQTAGQ